MNHHHDIILYCDTLVIYSWWCILVAKWAVIQIYLISGLPGPGKRYISKGGGNICPSQLGPHSRLKPEVEGDSPIN